MARPRKINEKSIYIRPALQGVIDRVEDYPITFIGAPAGYGKTVLVSAIEKEKRVLRFDVRQTDAENFRDELFDIVRDIKTWKEGQAAGCICIVVENVHELTDKSILNIIYSTASEPGSYFRFILTSRFNYYTENSPEVVSGNVNLVSADMFLLDRSEIIAYFSLCGIRIDAEMADQIYNRTGGCINIIFHILKRYITSHKLTFADDVADHLYHAQLAYLTADEETVGNRLSIMGKFTLNQARVMMERISRQEFLELGYVPNLESMLDELYRKNYFIHRNASSGEYEFNVFIRNRLMEIYRESYPEELEVMQEIVAEVHAEVGNYAQAAYYYYLCGDHHSMLAAIEKDNRISIENDNREAYIKYYRDSTRRVRSKHHLAVLYLAWRFFNYGELQLSEAASKEFLENLHGDENISDEKRRSLLCDYHLFSGMTGFYDLNTITQHYEIALSVFDGKPRIYHTVVPRTFGSISIMRVIFNTGTMEQLVDKIHYISEMGNKLIGNRWKGYDATTAAEVCFLKMDFDAAKIHLEKAIRDCREYGRLFGGTMTAISFLRSQIALMEGDVDYLRNTVTVTGMPQGVTISSSIGNTVEACLAWMYVQLDMPEKIEPWVRSGNFSHVHLMYPALPSMYLVHIYVLLAAGKYTKVLSYEEYFFKEGPATKNLLIRLEAAMIFAAAASELGKVMVARRYFEEALDLASETENQVSVILYGDRVLHLFSDVPERHKDMAAALLKKTRGFVAVRKRVRKQIESLRYMGLTEKEMQTARLVALGRTNKEIAKEISVSENTVKSTLKRIFAKLNITSRRQLSDLVRKYE